MGCGGEGFNLFDGIRLSWTPSSLILGTKKKKDLLEGLVVG